MKNERPDGQSVRTLLEAALAKSLGARAEPTCDAPGAGASPGGSGRPLGEHVEVADGSQSVTGHAVTGSTTVGGPVVASPVVASPASGSPVVVGEIVDTHHPHLPGRVLVRWWPSAESERSAWLHHERHLALARGDRVLVTLPLGWTEWIVTGAIGRAASAGASRGAASNGSASGQVAPVSDEAAPRLQLGPGQALVVVGHDGEPLLQLRQAPEGLCLELVHDQVEIKARRRLRLSSDSIELSAGPGGVDVRTDGDAVTRARTIRLN